MIITKEEILKDRKQESYEDAELELNAFLSENWLGSRLDITHIEDRFPDEWDELIHRSIEEGWEVEQKNGRWYIS